MTTDTAALGFRLGWDDAARYARGTKSDRREIRRRLAKSEVSYAIFWTNYQDAITARAEDFATAIIEGRIARTIRPSRLRAICNRQYTKV